MIGRIHKSLHYGIINSMPGKKKGKKRGNKRKSKPGSGASERDYRGVDGVVDDAYGGKK